MGKYGGKVLTIYITPTGVRVVEGENKNGNPHVSRYFVVRGVEDYFTEVPSDPGNYEITNMTGLVDTIVQECKAQRANCRRVMLCSNCFGIKTEPATGASKGSMKGLLTGDIMANIKAMRESKESGPSVAPDQMHCTINWGELVEDGKVVKRNTVTIGDKFILKSLVQEFYRKGYDVLSISDNVGCLMNLRQTEEATFDNNGKIIFDFDSSYHMIAMKSDIPITIDPYTPMTSAEILDRVDSLMLGCAEVVGRKPLVYLTGSLMEDTMLYSALIDKLESLGYVVYDLFDRPQETPGGPPPFTADYTANLAMLMAAYAKNVVTLLPSVEFEEIFRKNSKAIAALFLIIAFLFTGVSAWFAFNRYMEMQIIQGNPAAIESMQSQIGMLQQNQASLESTIDTLTKADVTVLDLINFIEYNQSEFVSIVSMDTQDMLVASPATDSEGNTAAAPQGTTVTDAEGNPVATELSGVAGGGSAPIREKIIIRGFARTGPAAINYYDKMFNSGLPIDPVLNGIEKFTLPNGEEVYIFEISIGGASDVG